MEETARPRGRRLAPASLARGDATGWFETLYSLAQGDPRAIACIAGFVAPGGSVLVIRRGRDPDGDPSQMPWRLTRAEPALFRDTGLHELSIEDYIEQEDSAVRRFRAEYRKDASPPTPCVH
jgi:hypothetical protein